MEFVDIETRKPFGQCAKNPFLLGRTFVVTPRMVDGKLHDSGCIEEREVKRAPILVGYVRDYFADPGVVTVRGLVAAHTSAIPVAGATVRTQKDGQTYSTVSDAQGGYVLRLPATGTYTLEAVAPGYPAKRVRREVSRDRRGASRSDSAVGE